MSQKKYAVVRGKRATDDLLTAELSSPAGEASFNCPDCGEIVRVQGSGDVRCTCGSVFSAHKVPSHRSRDKFAIRRKSVD